MSTPNYPVPPPPSAPAPKASSQATTALILGIVSLVFCGLLGPVAWYIGDKEVKAIRAGYSSPAGEGIAKAGMILGIVATALLLLGVLFVVFFVVFPAVFFGGLGMLGGLMESLD